VSSKEREREFGERPAGCAEERRLK